MHNINYIGAIKCISTSEFDYIRFMYICCSSSLNFCSDYMHFFDSLFLYKLIKCFATCHFVTHTNLSFQNLYNLFVIPKCLRVKQ